MGLSVSDAVRVFLMREANYSKSFPKDWDRLSRAGRYDMHRLKEAMLLLIGNDGSLGPEWLDHPLGGDWEGPSRSNARAAFQKIGA